MSFNGFLLYELEWNTSKEKCIAIVENSNDLIDQNIASSETKIKIKI